MQGLGGRRPLRRDEPAEDQHRRQVLHGKSRGVDELHQCQDRQRGRHRGDCPAQDGGACGAGGQASGAETLDKAAAAGEEQDFGDDALGDQQADNGVADPLGAPEQGREAVVGGVGALDERGAADSQPECAVAEQFQACEGVRGGRGRSGLGQEDAEYAGRAVADGQHPGHQPGADPVEQPARHGRRGHEGRGPNRADRTVFNAALAGQGQGQ